MRHFRLLATAVLLTAVALSASACTESPTPSVARMVAAPDAADQLLFVARSAHGSLAAKGGVTTLTLDDLRTVTWFADRPARDSGITTVADALDSFGWSKGSKRLGDDPPNATLTADELGKKAIVLELNTASIHGSSVTFTVTSHAGAKLSSTSLTAAELFIDSGDLTRLIAASMDQRTFTYTLTSQLSIVTTLFDYGSSEVVQVQVLSGSLSLYQTALRPETPVSSTAVDLTGVGLTISSLSFTPATPSGPGSIVASGTLSGRIASRPVPFTTQVATWSLP